MPAHPTRPIVIAPLAVTLAAAAFALAALAAAPALPVRPAKAPYFPPPGQWARKAPADLGIDAAHHPPRPVAAARVRHAGPGRVP